MTWEDDNAASASGFAHERCSSRADSAAGNELRPPSQLPFVVHDNFQIKRQISDLIEDIMTAQRVKRMECYELPDENEPPDQNETKQEQLAKLFDRSKLQLERALEANSLQRKRNILYDTQTAEIPGLPTDTVEAPERWMLELDLVRIRSMSLKRSDPNKIDMALKQLKKLVVEVMTDTCEMRKKLWSREYKIEEMRFMTKSPKGSIQG